MKQFTGAAYFRVVFIIIQIILYVTFLALDFSNSNITLSSYIKFSVIILCFCYALFSEGQDKSISFCMKAAMLFTLVSDLFILILDYYLYGVLTFIVVQQLYSFRLCLEKRNHKAMEKRNLIGSYIRRIAVQLSISLLICCIFYLADVKPDALLIVSIFYFICILTNTVRAASAALSESRNKGIVLYAAGMILFLLCDINVGLFNLSGFIALPDKAYHIIYSFSSILMWTFYAPAQVLIALSINENQA